MTLPHNSPEVEAEVLEISTALAIELKADLGSYADCFRNTENRNGWRMWMGTILMQGVSHSHTMLSLEFRQIILQRNGNQAIHI